MGFQPGALEVAALGHLHPVGSKRSYDCVCPLPTFISLSTSINRKVNWWRSVHRAMN